MIAREDCIMAAFKAILADPKEYDRIEVPGVVPVEGRRGMFRVAKLALSCEDSTAEYAVRFGDAMWRRMLRDREEQTGLHQDA